jgi:hypothetical protein
VPTRPGQRAHAAEGASRAASRRAEHGAGEVHPSKRLHERPTLIRSTIHPTHCHRDRTLRLALRMRWVRRCTAHLRRFIACPGRGAIRGSVVYLDKYLLKYRHAMRFCNPAARHSCRAAQIFCEMTRAYQEFAA